MLSSTDCTCKHTRKQRSKMLFCCLLRTMVASIASPSASASTPCHQSAPDIKECEGCSFVVAPADDGGIDRITEIQKILPGICGNIKPKPSLKTSFLKHAIQHEVFRLTWCITWCIIQFPHLPWTISHRLSAATMPSIDRLLLTSKKWEGVKWSSQSIHQFNRFISHIYIC